MISSVSRLFVFLHYRASLTTKKNLPYLSQSLTQIQCIVDLLINRRSISRQLYNQNIYTTAKTIRHPQSHHQSERISDTPLSTDRLLPIRSCGSWDSNSTHPLDPLI